MRHEFATIFFIILLTAIPLIGVAQNGLVPCDGTDCTFDSLILLAKNIMNWLIFIAVPIAIILFSWAGIKYITAGGNTGQIAEAHTIFKNVLIGFIIVLAAWLIVFTVTNALLDPDARIETFLEQP